MSPLIRELVIDIFVIKAYVTVCGLLKQLLLYGKNCDWNPIPNRILESEVKSSSWLTEKWTRTLQIKVHGHWNLKK
jgi:hypothetical protein